MECIEYVQKYSIIALTSTTESLNYTNTLFGCLDRRILVMFYLNITDNDINIQDFLEHVRSLTMNGNAYVIIFWPNHNETEAKMLFQNLEIQETNLTTSFGMNSNIFLSINDRLWEFYWIKDEFVFNVINPNEFQSSGRRGNLLGTTISAVAVYNNGYDGDAKFYVTNDTSIDAGNENYSLSYSFASGLSVSIYWDLKFMLNFSEEAVPGDWISINSNGTPSGLSADALLKGIADISISQDNMRAELAQHVIGLHPTYPLNVVAFIEDLSNSLSLSRDIYLEPFNNVMWICIGILICSIPIFLALTFKIHQCTIKKYGEPDHVHENHNRDELLYIRNESYVFGIAWISQQSWYYFPKHLTLQIIFITCYAAGVILNAAYTASLVSKLSVRNQPINSFQELFANDYQFVILETSASMIEYGQGFAEYYGVPVQQQIYEEICSNVLSSKTALIYYWDSVSLIFDKCSPTYKNSDNSKEPIVCDALITFWVRKNLPSGMVLPKGSPFREIFNIKILKIKETGLNNRYIKIYELGSQPNCFTKEKSKYHKLGLEDTYSSHLILLFGILLSLLIMCTEKFISRSKYRLRQ